MSPRVPGLALALPLALACCRPIDPRGELPFDTLDPVVSSTGLTFVEPGRGRAITLDLSGTAAHVRHVAVGPRAVRAIARPGHDEVLVLTQGRTGTTTDEPLPAALDVVPSGSMAGAVRSYTLASPFNAMETTGDGRFAFVHSDASSTAEGLLFNPNEVAVVDLTAAPSSGNPVRRTVRSFGGVPDRVLFTPPITIRGESRTLAVVLSSAYLTLLDLAHLDRSETTIRLTLPEDPRAVGPEQLLVDADAKTLYLRASASNDIYVVHLDDTAAPPATGNDFRASVNQLAAGVQPADLALFGTAASRKLLVVSRGSRDVRVIDTRSDATTTIALDAPADSILLFDGTSPRDATSGPRALLYSADPATGASAASFVDLSGVESRGVQNVETVQLGRVVRAALPLPDRKAVLFEHAGDGAGGRLNLLDLQVRTTSPIVAAVSLFGAFFSADRARLWVSAPGDPRLGYIDLADFHPGELLLDAPVSSLVALPAGAGGAMRIVARHPSSAGHLTVFDGLDPRRETAWSVRGFLLTDLLAEEAP